MKVPSPIPELLPSTALQNGVNVSGYYKCLATTSVWLLQVSGYYKCCVVMSSLAGAQTLRPLTVCITSCTLRMQKKEHTSTISFLGLYTPSQLVSGGSTLS